VSASDRAVLDVPARRWPARFGETAQRIRAANAMFRELHRTNTITTLTSPPRRGGGRRRRGLCGPLAALTGDERAFS